MIATIKVLQVGGKSYPISEKLCGMLEQDKELEAEITALLKDAKGKKDKKGK